MVGEVAPAKGVEAFPESGYSAGRGPDTRRGNARHGIDDGAVTIEDSPGIAGEWGVGILGQRGVGGMDPLWGG